jgi:hypothetical protein
MYDLSGDNHCESYHLGYNAYSLLKVHRRFGGTGLGVEDVIEDFHLLNPVLM